MNTTMNDNSVEPLMTNNTGDISQVNMQSTAHFSDSGKIEADGSGETDEKSEWHDGSGGGGYDDSCDSELKTEEISETEKDLSYETSEIDTDSSKDDGIKIEPMEYPRKVEEFIGETSSSSILVAINSVPANEDFGGETVTIEKISYEKLIAEQKRLTDELKRLKERLITVEDDYTTEILELEDRESKVRNELNQALEAIAQLKTCIKEVDQPSNWSERMEQLKAERDVALDDVSKLDDKVHRLTASVTNLQLVIEQIQKENEKKVTSLTKQHLAALESERAIQNDLRQEVDMYKKKSMESAQALEAATRLTENIDKKEELIQNLKQELCDKEKQIANLEVDKGHLKASFEGKVDKQVIKNLILGYFGTPNNKKHEVERLLARVLDFNEQEMIRAGLSFGRPSSKLNLDTFASSGSSSSLINPTSNSAAAAAAGSFLLAPLQSTSSTGYQHSSSSVAVSSTGLPSPASSSTSSYSNDPTTGTSGSLSKMFVEFLEAESRPKGTLSNVHPTSSLTRELARDLTKVALTPNNKTHIFLEPALSIGPAKVTPVPIAPTSNTSGSQQQSIGNILLQSNSNQLANPLIASTALPSTSNINKSQFSGNQHSNPIRPITINSINNISDCESSLVSMGSMSTVNQHQKSSSLSSISSSSSSSSLILSNPMPSFTNAMKPITFDANNHTHIISQPLSSSSSTTINPQPKPLIAQQPSTSLSSHHLLSMSETTHTKPSPPSSSSLITTYSTTCLTPSTTTLDYNSILSNSHLKVKK